MLVVLSGAPTSFLQDSTKEMSYVQYSAAFIPVSILNAIDYS